MDNGVSPSTSGCKYCNEHGCCITYHNNPPTEEEREERLLDEKDRFEVNNAEHNYEKLHARDEAAYINSERYVVPKPRNRVDHPWCDCIDADIVEYRRGKGNPPASIEPNIQQFVDAVNADQVEYMINDRESTQELIDEAAVLVKVNPLVKKVDHGTWGFIGSPQGDTYNQYYCIFKTHTLGFQMSGPRSYLNYMCKTCRKGWKIGYMTKHISRDGSTATFAGDERIDEIMGIQNPPKYRLKFSNDYE